MTAETQPLFLKSLQQLQTAFWLRRAAHWVIRAAWLALLVPTIFMAGYLWLNWEVRWYYWTLPMLLIVLLSLLWSSRPISRKRIACRLDDRLELQTRLTTALEISDTPQTHNPVEQHLLQETEEITATLRRGVPLVNRTLWVEIQALIAVAAILGALLMIDSLAPRIPQVNPTDLPATWKEPSASEVLPSENPPLAQSIAPEDVQTDPMHEEDFQTALRILADVLRDHAVTHSIAEAIDDNDLERAAQNLRRLADQLDNLSPEARAELSNLLQEAADKIGNIAPSITDPLQAGSAALDNDDLLQAGQSLEELARVLEEIEDSPAEVAEYKEVAEENIPAPDPLQTEQSPASPQDDTMDDNPIESETEQDEQPTEEERLAMEGDPLELESEAESEESVVQEADPDAEAGDAEAEDAPFTRQPLDAPAQQLGRDPLIYPWEKREVIRRYFTP
ncbi:MAG: hypothetical protein JW953_24010 [Anaerolineae bacterium]|nr:hypothetical protein [Anaerolineae bacterium]